MSYCSNCGNQINYGADVCLNCGKSQINTIQNVRLVQNDSSSTGFWCLGFFIPLAGLILYFVWKDDKPLKAKSAGQGALISIVIGIIFYIIYIFFLLYAFY